MTESSHAPIPAGELDGLPRLPGANRRSIVLVMVVQALNAFNDNFVKLLLISLALTVAQGSEIGRDMEIYLGAIFALPYILFAPLAGYWSDRASKQRVIVWMQAAQLVCFAWFAIALMQRQVPGSLIGALAGFFLLATQAAFFSPAKMGIMKELAGSRRLGLVSGWQQMTMMAGILAGMWAGGTWYGQHYEQSGDPWTAAIFPLLIVGILAAGELLMAWWILRTPVHSNLAFHRALWWEHFAHLKLVFGRRPIRLSALGITYFWFVSNSVGLILVTLTKELHPDTTHGAGAMELARVAAVLGIGVIVGSLLASVVCKRRIEMGLIPLGGFGLMAGLCWAGLAPQGSGWMYAGLVFTGAAGGCFMVPLYAFVQDRSLPDERARILASINLLDCLAAFLAAGIVFLLKRLGLGASGQFLALALPTLVMACYTTRLLPQDFVRVICLSIIRSVYRVKVVGAGLVPREGGVLLLPNHASYVDALIVSVGCPRPVRFVMWDVLYEVWWMNGFLRLFGTVPISSTRAKDAIRTVSDSLKEQEAVCLFPEGQITRLGMMNPIRKGFELMARQGQALVQPVYLDGLYGSIFSFKGGRCFKKWPKRVRYPVAVHFGEPLAAREATTERIREALLALGSQAFLARKQFEARSLPDAVTKDADEPAVKQALANAMRLADIELLKKGDTVVSLSDARSTIGRTLAALPAANDELRFADSLSDAAQGVGRSVVAVAVDQAAVQKLSEWTAWRQRGRLVLWWGGAMAEPDRLEWERKLGTPVLIGWFDTATGALIAQSVPDPVMPKGEEGNQSGSRAGSPGRLLPGLRMGRADGALEVSGLAPASVAAIRLPGFDLDEDGFLVESRIP